MSTSTWSRPWWRTRLPVRADADRRAAARATGTAAGPRHLQRFGDAYRWPDGSWTTSGSTPTRRIQHSAERTSTLADASPTRSPTPESHRSARGGTRRSVAWWLTRRTWTGRASSSSSTRTSAGPSWMTRRWVEHYLPQWTTPERSAARYDLEAWSAAPAHRRRTSPHWRVEDGEMRVSEPPDRDRVGADSARRTAPTRTDPT